MRARNVTELEEQPVTSVMGRDELPTETNTITVLAAMARAAGHAPSVAERAAMNTLAASRAGDELRGAAREWLVASKARWASMVKNVPSCNKAARPAHKILCSANTAAWNRCVDLMEVQGLEMLPGRREFLTYLAEL